MSRTCRVLPEHTSSFGREIGQSKLPKNCRWEEPEQEIFPWPGEPGEGGWRKASQRKHSEAVCWSDPPGTHQERIGSIGDSCL